MKYQSLFSVKNKKNISKCHLREYLPSMLCIKTPVSAAADNVLRMVERAYSVTPVRLSVSVCVQDGVSNLGLSFSGFSNLCLSISGEGICDLWTHF